MNRLLCTLLVAIAAMGVGRAQVKIAVINSQKALLETDEIKKAQTDLEARFKPRQDKIVQLEKELQDLQAQLQSGKLSAAGEQELTAQGQKKQRDLQRLQQDLQDDVERERTISCSGREPACRRLSRKSQMRKAWTWWSTAPTRCSTKQVSISPPTPLPATTKLIQ